MIYFTFHILLKNLVIIMYNTTFFMTRATYRMCHMQNVGGFFQLYVHSVTKEPHLRFCDIHIDKFCIIHIDLTVDWGLYFGCAPCPETSFPLQTTNDQMISTGNP